jgi:putative spermidine/putrescine transport system ATP-binding protein
MVRLEGLGGRYPRQLSGGQQQRVALARALAFHPTLLLMDEPLGALDRALRMEMEEELRRIHRESGTTVVYVTHDQEEALTLSDRIGVMREGSLLQVGSPQNLFESPAERFIATFFGECTLIPARTTGSVDGGRRAVDVLGQHAVVRQGAALDGPDVLVAVRPSRLRLRARPGDLVVESDVVDVLYLGEVARLVCRHDEASTVIVRADARDAMSVAPGGRLRLGFSPDDAVLVPR